MSPVPVVFHADLSDVRQDVDYFLYARGELHSLVPHDEASREAARQAAPFLRDVADGELTHYSPAPVPMNDEMALRVHVAYRDGDGELPAEGPHVGHASIFIPDHGPGAPAGDRLEHHHHIDWIGTAKTFLFHHSDLHVKNKKFAGVIFDYMDEKKSRAIYQQIEDMAGEMRKLGEPGTASGWAHLEPYPYNGKTRYMHRPVQTVLDAARPALRSLMTATKSDTTLQDVKWRQSEGFSTRAARQPSAATTGSAAGSPQWSVSLAKDFMFDGVKPKITLEDGAKGEGKEPVVKLEMENFYVRYLSVYVQFFDADGKAMKVCDWKPEGGVPGWLAAVEDQLEELELQTDTLRFVGTIDPIDTVLGVPVPGTAHLIGESEGYGVGLPFPEQAVSAGVYACGLGTGSGPNPGAYLYGSCFTVVCNLLAPSLMMAFDVASNSYKPLYQFIKKLLKNMALVVIGVIAFIVKTGVVLTVSSLEGHPDWAELLDALKTGAGKIVSFALQGVEELLKDEGVEDAAEKAAEEIPFAGWIIAAAAILADVAQMAETIVEVLASPWQIENSIHLTIRSEVLLEPDPRHGTFPEAGAGQRATYSLKIVHDRDAPTLVHQGDVPADPGSQISFQFQNPLGGKLKVEAEYRIDGVVHAKATTGWMRNDAPTTGTIHVPLVQHAVPLSPETTYEHARLLGWDAGAGSGGAYVWRQTSKAPTDVYEPHPDPRDNDFAGWNGLGFDAHRHRLLWAWQAAGTGLRRCGGDGSQGLNLHAFMEAAIPGLDPDARFPTCGFQGPSNVVADTFPPRFLKQKDGQWKLDGQGRPVPDPEAQNLGAFFVDPRKAGRLLSEDGGYHLRAVAPTGAIDPAQTPLSHGRFRYAPDSLTLHPSGHVVGLSRRYCKIQVGQLSRDGAPDNAVAVARCYSGQGQPFGATGVRPGLLVEPLAVASTYDGTLLVLENLRRDDFELARIQAFDIRGNPVRRFVDEAGKPSPFLPVPVENRTYRDLAAVGDLHQTYLFVLYHEGDGKTAADYGLEVYAYGEEPPAKNPLLSVGGFAAGAVTADMWNTLYALDFGMTRDADGHLAGPHGDGTGPAGRTVPALSSWLPQSPKES